MEANLKDIHYEKILNDFFTEKYNASAFNFENVYDDAGNQGLHFRTMALLGGEVQQAFNFNKTTEDIEEDISSGMSLWAANEKHKLNLEWHEYLKTVKDANTGLSGSDRDVIKRMNIREFRELGYLQEVNRRFFHPLGLALEIDQSPDGTETLGGIWDYRGDKEGIIYALQNSELNMERKARFQKNKKFIDNEFEVRMKNRLEILGFDIEPVD